MLAPGKAPSDERKSSNDLAISPPSISLPKGGGAIRGIGEKFAANPVTGTGSLSVPIPTSATRAGFGPHLSLSYDSGSGNGPFGFGWHLSLPRITRKTDKGLPEYHDGEESDVFILSGAEDLVPTLSQASGSEWSQERTERDGFQITRYRPRIEGLFARIERWTRQSDGDTHWRSISKENITTIYGKDSQDRIVDSSGVSRIFSWLISESYDDKGNAILYEYAPEDSSNIDPTLLHERNRSDASRSSNRYLKRIKYGNATPRQLEEDLRQRTDWLFEVVFDYDQEHLELVKALDDSGAQQIVQARISAQRDWLVRSDAFSTYRAGFEVRTYRLCRNILMFHHFAQALDVEDCLVRVTEFAYRQSAVTSFISSMCQSGCARQSDGSYLKKSLPPLEFQYTSADIQDEVFEVDGESLENLPCGLDGTNYEWVDLDGEGISGILSRGDQGWIYKRNYSPVSTMLREDATSASVYFGDAESVGELPSIAGTKGSRTQFVDLAGDGRPDVVRMTGAVAGFHERTVDGRWDCFTAFVSKPVVDWDDPHLKLIDLTGDGHADILVTEDDVFTWYPSLAAAGFDCSARVSLPLNEEDGPRLVFADRTDSIYLADFSGDGLTDLVRIRNGEVCYWPNLGYGQFGKKITMDNPPWFDAADLFDQKRIRLADIDGSGTTDILYLNADQIDVYRNQCGNSWSEAETLSQFPSIDDLSAVQAVDLLGNGTACLVWSSPLQSDARNPMRYIDLMGGQKPHLLVKMINNLGAETCIKYAPSTRFYLADKLAGTPWITRLPFPVHVVERVESYDRVSRSRFVTRYAYHHGYFDGPEREFRGFGMVEQWDTEEFATLSTSDAFPTGDNVDETSHVPPMLTKTWFHTGAYLEGESTSQRYVNEYYREADLPDDEALAQLLPDTILPEGLDTTETREAVRALKGAILRQEVYALDGTEQSAHPYSVSERNYSIRCLQPANENPYAVFFVHPREQVDFHYERESADPRVGHTLTLEVDDFGNVTKSSAVGYGRRTADPSLSASDQTKQTALLITFNENTYTNGIEENDAHRTPLLCEAEAYEITGLSPADGSRFGFDELNEAVETTSELVYEGVPDGSLQKRLLSRMRTLFRADDLSGPLSTGGLESLALPYESYGLAFTPGLIERIYSGKGVDAILSSEGGYVDLDGDSHWWLPSGRSYFSTDPDASADDELTEAHAHFFLPRRFENAFGASSLVDYDDYGLLVAQTIDAVGNTTVATNDYRVLQPASVTDANGNRTSLAFDALGLVVATAIMAKESQALGDSLDTVVWDLEPESVVDFLANPLTDPLALLQNATSRLVYDLFAYYRTRDSDSPQPSVVSIIARETHVSDLTGGAPSKVQVNFSYSDGFGREIQKKIQAEPGPLEKGGAEVNPRWVGSGWTIFNNKGNPVRKYEPFFSTTHAFEFARTAGVSPILIYDPPQRVVATLHPNHAWEKVVFDPWQQQTWDANDTVLIADAGQDVDVGALVQRLEPSDYLTSWYAERLAGGLGEDEEAAAAKAAPHANTPTTVYLDTLGRPFLSVADNGTSGKYETRTALDVRGLALAITDARGNPVMGYTYDLLKRQLYSNSMDAGERWNLPDAIGNPIRAWDSREQTFRTIYDELQRPTHLFVTRGSSVEVLVERTVFGEAHSGATALNLRGKVYQLYDSAGVVTNEKFDFKGNLLQTNRRLATEYRTTVDWAALEDLTDTEEIKSAAEALLEDENFSRSTTYDALNRAISQTLPDQTEIQPTYNEANLLEQVKARLSGATNWTTFVENIDYNAKGQRELIEYKNGVVTEYEYDERTFQLIRLNSTRSSNGDLQNLSYAYDPVGNITSIRDDAQQTIYFAGEEVTPDAEYVYDAIYRLIEAAGREHIGQTTQVDENDPPYLTIPHPKDTQAMRRYTEKYDYDEVGNILKMTHIADTANWTRYYAYESANNRLNSTSLPGDDPLGPYSAQYTHDAHGNMTSMPHLASIELDFKDRMQQADLGGGGTVYFVYDAAGQRVRKVYEHDSATVEERIYLGAFEIYRKRQGDDLKVELQTLHVMDDKRRIALVETKTYEDKNIDDPAPLIRYQLGNHLGSSCLELDESGAVISYEEYHSYGSTAYHASDASDKRYRYTGKEKDEESGLYYCEARCYACWLARWCTADPAGISDGDNGFQYVSSNPIAFVDPMGMQGFSFVTLLLLTETEPDETEIDQPESTSSEKAATTFSSPPSLLLPQSEEPSIRSMSQSEEIQWEIDQHLLREVGPSPLEERLALLHAHGQPYLPGDASVELDQARWESEATVALGKLRESEAELGGIQEVVTSAFLAVFGNSAEAASGGGTPPINPSVGIQLLNLDYETPSARALAEMVYEVNYRLYSNPNQVLQYLKPEQLDAIARKGPWLERVFWGTAVQNAVNETIAQSSAAQRLLVPTRGSVQFDYFGARVPSLGRRERLDITGPSWSALEEHALNRGGVIDTLVIQPGPPRPAPPRR